jgi:hypothetical protein
LFPGKEYLTQRRRDAENIDDPDLISVMVCLAKDFAEREHPLLMNIRREGVAVA